MRLRFLLFFTALVTTLQVKAQTPPWVIDSIQSGPHYGNDVHYSMKNGANTPVSNTNWHIGFEMVPGGPGYGGVSIIANHVQGGVKVFSLHLTATAKFASLNAADTANKTLLYNSDSSWDMGAFYMNHDPLNPLDFGWGEYNMTSHDVVGDSLYMIYAGGNVYKMVIQLYNSSPVDSIYYVFHVAKFDNTGDYVDTVWKKPNYVNKNFAYYDITTNTFLNREPDHNAWDIVFTRYIENVLMGPPPAVPYPVAGVLSNMGVYVAKVKNVNPDTALQYQGYTFDNDMHHIGSDWKSFTPPTGPWVVDTTASYYIQTVDTAIYQLKFIKFESGSGPTGTGKVVFGKRMLAFAAGVPEVEANIATHALVPNPASNSSDLVINAKAAANAQMLVTDITGRIMQRSTIGLTKGLNAFRINTETFNNGMYMITVTDGNLKITDKLIVQH